MLTNRQRARGNWRWIMVATMGMTGVAAAAWAWLVVVSSGAILVPDHPVNALSLLLATVAVNTNTPASFSLSVISPTSNCTASFRSTG